MKFQFFFFIPKLHDSYCVIENHYLEYFKVSISNLSCRFPLEPLGFEEAPRAPEAIPSFRPPLQVKE